MKTWLVVMGVVGAAYFSVTTRLQADQPDVCVSLGMRKLPSLRTPYKLILKQYDGPFWGEWERAVNSEVERQVAEINAKADNASQVYALTVESSLAMRDKVGRVLAASVICSVEGAGDQCRNHNYWGGPDIDPVLFADIVLRNTLADQPLVDECKKKSFR